MSEGYPTREFEHADVIRRVIELAKLGQDALSGFKMARFTPSQEDIEWILAQLIDEQIYKCAATIKYADGTDFDISWQNGNVWSLTFTDPKYAENPDRVIPFSGGMLRRDYVSHREITPDEEASSVLGLHNILEQFAEENAESGLVIPTVSDIAGSMESIREKYKDLFEALGEAITDVDPADLDLPQIYGPILDILPERDLIPLELPGYRDFLS